MLTEHYRTFSLMLNRCGIGLIQVINHPITTHVPIENTNLGSIKVFPVKDFSSNVPVRYRPSTGQVSVRYRPSTAQVPVWYRPGSNTVDYQITAHFTHNNSLTALHSQFNTVSVCKECGRIFTGISGTASANCRRHYETVHLRLQKFACLNCGRKFAHNSSRKRHARLCGQPLQSL